jgi:Helix-turn-helix
MNDTKSDQVAEQPPAAEWRRPAMAAALEMRDFTTVFRLLQKIGYSQNKIAAMTHQSQPEVSAIIHGRTVMAYDVIRRVADGLGVPPCVVGVASCRDLQPEADASAIPPCPGESSTRTGHLCVPGADAGSGRLPDQGSTAA